MSALKKTRRDFAMLGNHLISCSGVTYNEQDDREQFTDFKMYCGKVSRMINDEANKWNEEIFALCALEEDDEIALNLYEEKLKDVNAIHDKKERKKERKALKEENAELLKKDKEATDRLQAYYDEEVELELPSYFRAKTPLNINGAYLDIIKDLLED